MRTVGVPKDDRLLRLRLRVRRPGFGDAPELHRRTQSHVVAHVADVQAMPGWTRSARKRLPVLIARPLHTNRSTGAPGAIDGKERSSLPLSFNNQKTPGSRCGAVSPDASRNAGSVRRPTRLSRSTTSPSATHVEAQTTDAVTPLPIDIGETDRGSPASGLAGRPFHAHMPPHHPPARLSS